MNLEDLMEKTVSVKDYITNMEDPFKARFLKRMKTYVLKEEVVEKLKAHADRIFVLVFSAKWCPDCSNNVPILALLSEKVGLKVRVFGGIMKDPLNPKEKWKIPPSPPEVKEFKVERIPHIVIFKTNGQELGKIIENPNPNNTLEEEILQLVKND